MSGGDPHWVHGIFHVKVPSGELGETNIAAGQPSLSPTSGFKGFRINPLEAAGIDAIAGVASP